MNAPDKAREAHYRWVERNPDSAKEATRAWISRHPLYQRYIGMKQRCSNPKHSDYANYGGRGISVCPEWRECFRAYETWIMDHLGAMPAPGWQIDRRDNDGNYEPGNIRWVSPIEQARNKRPRCRRR